VADAGPPPVEGEPPMAHLAGWRHALATLAHAGAADQLAPVLGERVADWQAAWNEPEPARRLALLERCLADGGGSATRRPPSTAPPRWPTTSAWSSGWSSEAPRRPATAWSASAGRPSARARPSWSPAPTWPGPTRTGGSSG
jgi:hypothetical protein